mgnify:CR=1 FL=1
MNTLILAIKNIFKNRRRTVITFLAITSGMTGLIVFGGYMEFTFMGLRESTIRTQLGHVQVAKKGYFEKGLANQGKYLIRESESVERVLARMPEVKLVTSRLTFSGLISTGERTLSCKGFGINVAEENAGDMNTFETVVDGQQLDESTGPGDGVVGVELMKALGAKVGDYLTLLTTTIDGTMNALEFKVVGVAETGSGRSNHISFQRGARRSRRCAAQADFAASRSPASTASRTAASSGRSRSSAAKNSLSVMRGPVES